MTSSSTTSSGTWSFVAIFVSPSSLVKDFRDLTITFSGISSKVWPTREVSLTTYSFFLCFCKAFSTLAFFLAYVREQCLALAMVATSAFLGRGEAGLGVGWEGRAKDGEGKGVEVPRTSNLNDGEAGLGWDGLRILTSLGEGGESLDDGWGWKSLILMVGYLGMGAWSELDWAFSLSGVRWWLVLRLFG